MQEFRLGSVTALNNYLTPWVIPRTVGGMPVIRTDPVQPEDIRTGRMLVIMAEHSSSVTAWPDIPYEICKITHVPAEFMDSPEEVQFTVEFYTADK